MMKRKENKNFNLKMVIVLFVVFAFLSWFFQAASYQTGALAKMGWYRAGFYDLIAVIFSGLAYKISDLFYILFVGGLYGLLVKAESYKRIVVKTADFVKKYNVLSFALITLLVGLYTSFSTNIITLFLIVPFIVSAFLKSGHDKLTAISAGFGGLFLGYLGQIAGTYGNDFIYEYFSIQPTHDIFLKIVIFIIACVLYNVFAIYHIKKNMKSNEEIVDMFEIEEVKKITKKSQQIMTWPTVVSGIIVLLIIMLGYIPWIDAFGITFFDKMHSAVMNFSLGDIKVIETLLGTTLEAMGAWTDCLPIMFMLSIFGLVVVITNRISFTDLCTNVTDGVRKISKVALSYGLAFAFFYLMVSYPWSASLVDLFIKTDAYNVLFILFILIASFLALMFCVDPLYSGYFYGQYISAIFTFNLGITALLWHLGSGIALLIAPTSFLLLAALSYVDISYKEWLKYIWKFVLSFFIIILLILSIVIM